MSVVSLPEAKRFLKITEATDDALLQGYIDAAQAQIEQRVGPLEETDPITERVTSNGATLLLQTVPVHTLTSVTPADGAAIDVAGLYVDDESGVVETNNGIGFFGRYFTVVYTAGRAEGDVHPDLILAVEEQLRVLWSETQRGGGVRPGPAAPGRVSNTIPGAEQKLSDKVTSLIQDHLLDGFA